MVKETWTGWKALAIVFIILFISETIFIVVMFVIGARQINREARCSNEICNGYDAFIYQDNTCYCYRNNEVALTKYLVG